MQPSRGDSKPCERADCSGLMRFARPSGTGPRNEQLEPLRWLCANEASHGAVNAGGAQGTRTPAVPSV
jgi:hypothetical protein